jgi:DNA-binding transcriptional MerR regulator
MRIGELAKRSGLTASRIRFYEAKGLVSVTRRTNGYRAYSAEALVREIPRVTRLANANNFSTV